MWQASHAIANIRRRCGPNQGRCWNDPDVASHWKKSPMFVCKSGHRRGQTHAAMVPYRSATRRASSRKLDYNNSKRGRGGLCDGAGGVLLIWIKEGQGPTALGWGCLDFFPLSFLFSFSLSLGDGAI